MDISRTLAHLRPGAQWSMTGNSIEGLQWQGPGDAPTQEELEAGWAELEARKIWPNAGTFWAEFTQEEKTAIVTSTIPDIKVLYADLQMWPGEVWSTDDKLQAGLNGLQLVTILTAERKAAILAK
jgi:hypothetical protein